MKRLLWTVNPHEDYYWSNDPWEKYWIAKNKKNDRYSCNVMQPNGYYRFIADCGSVEMAIEFCNHHNEGDQEMQVERLIQLLGKFPPKAEIHIGYDGGVETSCDFVTLSQDKSEVLISDYDPSDL